MKIARSMNDLIGNKNKCVCAYVSFWQRGRKKGQWTSTDFTINRRAVLSAVQPLPPPPPYRLLPTSSTIELVAAAVQCRCELSCTLRLTCSEKKSWMKLIWRRKLPFPANGDGSSTHDILLAPYFPHFSSREENEG